MSATLAIRRLDSFFDRALEVFHDAAGHAGGAVVIDYAIAGEPVRVHYGSRALAARLGTALEHLAAPAPGCPLVVHLWGGEMPRGLLQPPPWEDMDYFERGNVRAHQDERYAFIYARRPETFSALDNERRIGIYWARDAAGLPYYERSAPMRPLLQAWFDGRGLFVVHAAAVGGPGGGALISGRTGSGKSTTALTCLRAGLQYAGDDYVLVRAEPRPHAYSLYNSAKLNPEMLDWLPEAAPLVANRETLTIEKALVFLSPAWADRTTVGFPLHAVLLPRPTRETTTAVSRISPEAAYRAVAPDTLFTVLGRGRAVSSMLARLVRAVPCYEVALGTDLTQVAAVIARTVATGPN